MKANSYTYAKDLSKVTAISAVHFLLRHKENGCIYKYIYTRDQGRLAPRSLALR